MSSKDDASWFNSVEGREIEMPSANVQSNARSLGKVAALMANGGVTNGVRLLSEETVKLALSDNKMAYDGFMNSNYSFSKGGFSDFGDMESVTVNPDFKTIYSGFTGWGGLGGSLFLWNSQHKIGFNYAMNGKTLLPLSGPRGDRIMKAVQLVLRKI
jgi:CubicO group peptidase (beta-lactamase class C family)